MTKTKKTNLLGGIPLSVRSRDLYEEYVDHIYNINRVQRGKYWKKHYEKIEVNIIKILKKNLNEDQSIIEFLGVSSDDLEDGCIPLKKNGHDSEIMRFFQKAKGIIFREISDINLEQCLEKLSKIEKERLYLVLDDFTYGLSAEIEFFIQKKLRKNSIQKVCAELSQMEDFEFFLQNSDDFKKNNSVYPSVDLGFSLMIQTATILPAEIFLLKRLWEESALNNYSTEVIRELEEKIFSFTTMYNDFLLQKTILDWFKRNTNGKLVIFTDVEKNFYKKNKDGSYDESIKDIQRSYLKLSKDYLQNISSLGFQVTVLDDWEWKDEPDHSHAVAALLIEK